MSKKLTINFDSSSKISIYIVLLITVCSVFTSCTEEEKAPDVSDISVNIGFIRFDQIFHNLDTLDIQASLTQLDSKYPSFAPLFYQRVLPLINNEQPDNRILLGDNIKKYLRDDLVQSLYDTVQVVYPNLENAKSDIEQSIKYLKYYFPDKGQYNIYTFISEFGFQTFITNDVDGKEGIGVGLDMFLGPDYPYKKLSMQNPSFSSYITRSFNKDHITKKVMDAIIADIDNLHRGERLLDKMVSNGIRHFVLDKLMPMAADTVKWEFSEKQMDWVTQNESNIYVHVLSEDLLYETRGKKIKSLVDRSPSSKGMPAESPGRTANYIGYKIVEKFMSRTDISLDSLIRIQDAQFILDNSRYKPLNKTG